ncbi:Pimeloyl-ACP methyl ester carboxylesterase [Oryzisolibacter propanilivorax]|uniref:Pimeloyl-ACP methyl ester carboxylesterase n=1 Tax=Oryzisolibacter propanilivorax TaxID=1527607 RepID=A0A1G9UM36_9BURK|nr:alpha/beta hydrolase [Oryzisolibacter propanilivorax]SDM61012.1 Pimeloyl-ACP methyl ester carboxylesterase [Oryzisolibacter propanilivorax]
MQYEVHGAPAYCYTGGKPFDPAQPTAVLIHGVLGDHSVWAWQSRWLAHHGWNVLAVDLPGHGRSGGDAPESVEQAAAFVAALLDAAGVQRAALVGHSWGSLIALQAAADLGERISHLVLVGTAYPMKVSPALIEASQSDPEQALKLVNVFSRSTLAPPSGAGAWVYGAGMALGRRVLQGNRTANVFQRGFIACDRYANGEQAIAALQCPVLFVLGARDQMTPPKAARTLIDAARGAGKAVRVVELPVGHHQMQEAPEATLAALRDFLR